MNSSYVAPEWYMAVSFLAIGCYLVIPTSEAEGESVYLCKTPHLNEHNVVGQGDCFTARILTGLSGDCAGCLCVCINVTQRWGAGEKEQGPGTLLCTNMDLKIRHFCNRVSSRDPYFWKGDLRQIIETSRSFQNYFHLALGYLI